MGIWEEKISLNGLSQCLKGYNEGLRNEHCAYRYGNWKMGDSAYDENWRLSYKGKECICAFSSGAFSNTEEIENLTLPVEDFLRIYFTIANEYGNSEKISLDTVLNHPEISQKLDLSQALLEEDQKKWEYRYGISIEDDRIIQSISYKLSKKGIDLERYDDDKRAFVLGVPVTKTGLKVRLSLIFEGSLDTFEKSLKDAYTTFSPHHASQESLDTDLYMHKDVLCNKLKETYNFVHKFLKDYRIRMKIKENSFR